jgi:hypothetical protein
MCGATTAWGVVEGVTEGWKKVDGFLEGHARSSFSSFTAGL